MERFDVISAEEHQTPFVLQQLLVVQPVQPALESHMKDFMSGFFKGFWLVVKWTIILVVGLFFLGAIL